MSRNKCIIILSEKASGSSACQNLLAKLANVQHVSQTRHFQNETLFWTKAASVLGLPQEKMVDSEVPIEKEKARADLVSLLSTNLSSYSQPGNDHDLIMHGWTDLCKEHAPIFLEKSPHHLCQWSALELIWEYINQSDEVDTLMIGLIRNPMDTIYSQYREWKSSPEAVEKQWIRAYRNLQKFKEIASDKLVLLKYEEMVSSLEYFQPVFDFCEIETSEADKNYLHRKSLQKWKKDSLYGFTLSAEATELAAEFGYTEDVLVNEPNPFWPVIRRGARAFHKVKAPVRQFIRSRIK